MKPKVLIDGRMASTRPDGHGRYALALARSLSERGSLSYEPVFVVARTAPGGGPPPRSAWRGFETVEAAAPFLQPSELWQLPGVMRRVRPALYHSPTFSSLFGCPCPYVQTVHDLNHLRFGSLAKKLYYRFVLKPFARGANRLLAVSRFTRGELASWLKIEESSIGVVPNCLEPAESVLAETRSLELIRGLGLEPGRYFLCLSNPKPHKNVALLSEAYAVFARQWSAPSRAWPLVLNLPPLAEATGQGVLRLGRVEDELAIALNRHAGACVFPSLYEGFGLPPVEAAAIGVRVVVSRIPPHQEGLECLSPDEALWVEPLDFHGWVSALERVQRGELSAPSVETQLKIRARYSFQAMGEAMDAIYRRELGV